MNYSTIEFNTKMAHIMSEIRNGNLDPNICQVALIFLLRKNGILNKSQFLEMVSKQWDSIDSDLNKHAN